MQGTIKTLVMDRSFGFITPEGDAKDVFFHATGLQGVEFAQLKQGDAVTFDVEDTDKGPRAVNVSRAA